MRKAKSAEIVKFERKKTSARTGAWHVSWESCQLAAHTRLGRSVGREDRPPQWGVVHEHTPVSIPVFMNKKLRIRIFTDRPGQGETGHAHLSNTDQPPSMGRSVIPRYSAAQKKSPQIVPKITIFLVFMKKTQISLFALGKATPSSNCTVELGAATARAGFGKLAPVRFFRWPTPRRL